MKPNRLCTLFSCGLTLVLCLAVTAHAGSFVFTDTFDDIFNYRDHKFTLAKDSTLTVSLGWIGASGPESMEIVPKGGGCSEYWDSWDIDDPTNGQTKVWPLAAGNYAVRIWYGGKGTYMVDGIYTENNEPNDPEFSCNLDNSQRVLGYFPDVRGHLGYGRGPFPTSYYPDKFCNANYADACDLDVNDVFLFEGDGSSGNMMTVFLGGNLKPDFIEIYGSRRQLIDILASPSDGTTYGPFALDKGDNYIHVWDEIELYPIEQTDFSNHGSYRVIIHKGAYVDDAQVIGRQKCDDEITIEASVKNKGILPLTADTIVRFIAVRKNNHYPDDPLLTQSKTIGDVSLAGLAPGQSKKMTQKTSIDCDIDWTMSEIKIAVMKNGKIISPAYSIPLTVDPESRAMAHILYLLLGIK